MTLDEARAHVGKAVTYRPFGGPPEHGTIAAVSTVYVFVWYPGVRGATATYPEDLELRDCGRDGCVVGCPHDPGEGHSPYGYAANH